MTRGHPVGRPAPHRRVVAAPRSPWRLCLHRPVFSIIFTSSEDDEVMSRTDRLVSYKMSSLRSLSRHGNKQQLLFTNVRFRVELLCLKTAAWSQEGKRKNFLLEFIAAQSPQNQDRRTLVWTVIQNQMDFSHI